jgi:diguanylate cyclase (GGDEF)-like protein
MDTGGIPAATQTACALLICGLVQAELARYLATRAGRPVSGSGVSAVAVWIIAAVLTLPLPAVLVVAVALHAHEFLRGPREGKYRNRFLTGVGGAVLAWLALAARDWSAPVEAVSGAVVVHAALAGLLYIAVADGPALLRAARRLAGGEGAGDVDYGVTRAALGVLVGLSASLSVLAIPLLLLPVAYLQRSKRGHALHHAAAHDGKTLLLNHAAWQARGTAALAGHRARAHTAVLMVDVDHFKHFNDTYGHHAGDDVLTSVAHVLQTTTRRNDIVARFGGDEFTLLFPGITEDEAYQAAERIREQIGALTVITTNLHGRPTTISGITASIGLATTRHAEPRLDDLMVHADRSLYEAKELGRDRVCGPALSVAA